MTPRPRLLKPLAAFLLLLTTAGGARAADGAVPEKPAWRSLPAETALAVRLPQARRFVQAMRERTRFGSLLFSDDRRAQLEQLIKQSSPGQWDRLLGKLEDYNLGFKDLPRFFDGSCGMGLVLEPRPEREPLSVFLLWAEPGEDLAARLIEAVRMGVAETQDAEHPIRRLDEELAGRPVLHLNLPVTGLKDPSAVQFDVPDNFSEMSEEERRELFSRHREKVQDAEPVVVDRQHLFMTRMGGRLLIGMTSSQSKSQVRERLQQEKSIDWDAITGVEKARGVYARFLQSQEGEDGGFARSVLSTPGLREAMPAGMPLVEMDINTSVVSRLAEAYADADAEAGQGWRQGMQMLSKLGLDQIQALAARMSLDGQNLRFNSFISAPAPREAAAALLDQQPPVEPRPAPWVASDVLAYGHISAELGEIYRRVKEMVVAEMGDPARQGFQQVEASFNQSINAGPADVLSSLGHQHHLLSFETKTVTVEMPEFEPRGPDQPPERKMVERQVPQNRAAYVWQLRDDGVWKRILQFAGRFAAMTQGAMQRADEQGFTGWRMNQGPFQGGLFLGQGYLVFAIGEGVPERVLAMLRNPPTGEAALAESELYQQARELIDMRPGPYFSLSDTDRSMRNARRALERMITAEGPAANPFAMMLRGAMPGGPGQGSPEAQARREALLSLIPSDEELKGSFSASVMQAFLTDNGLVSEAAVEMRPADQ